MKYKPKFKIDDIVIVKDDFISNQQEKLLFIGKITGIRIFRKKKKRLFIKSSKPGGYFI